MNNGNDRNPSMPNRQTPEPPDPNYKQETDWQVDSQAGRQVDVTIDAQIDQLLCALASTPPPPGMETRILRSLDLQQAAVTAFPPSRLYASLRLATRRLPLSLAALSGALALAALFVSHRPRPATTRTAPVAALSAARSAPVSANAVAQIPSRKTRDKIRNTATASLQPPSIRAITQGQPQPAPDDLEALAVSEMNAPSMPAPPLPLTPQERLLLHVSRQNPDPQQVFNGDLRAQQDARQTDDFLAFFGKPLPPPQDAE